jgi:hypothetical protein
MSGEGVLHGVIAPVAWHGSALSVQVVLTPCPTSPCSSLCVVLPGATGASQGVLEMGADLNSSATPRIIAVPHPARRTWVSRIGSGALLGFAALLCW